MSSVMCRYSSERICFTLIATFMRRARSIPTRTCTTSTRLAQLGGTAMAHLVRTGLSLDRKLLLRFDRAIAKKGYNNRSEAVRDLIRDHLVS